MIWKELVPAFAVIELSASSTTQDLPSIILEPLSIDWEGICDGGKKLGVHEKIVQAVSAPEGCFKVYGELSETETEVLGYEFPGAFHPNWKYVLKERIEKKLLLEKTVE